jgi:serine/threonine protein kinase/tetratricopeptide (TPR) repeat protein
MTDQLDRIKAALANRYKIEHHLGAGGMATVYLAEDLKHKRKVAVKVLRPELAAVLGAERFIQEITTTANLQHPHILPLFDSDEADGFLYYVMPYIAGETLRDRLSRETQLSIEAAIEITKAVAGALDYAHSRGIIHRDIKPENILLQDGLALMADFGIALAVKAAGGERLTETGLSLGTPAYMSPEQIAGERDLDGRSDVYSLACVTYEMLAGDPPFIASTPQAVIAKHITDPAAPITTTRPGVSPAIAYALAKALNKTPVDRYESAGAFATGLTSETKGRDREARSILVLPFVNRSADPDNEYFSDGLTDEVISDLSGVSALSVISRNSAMALKGTTKTTPTLARELGVTHLVTGTVRRAGAALRVTADLVEASTDKLIWSEKFSGTIEDVFGIQEDISRQIVSALKVRLTDSEAREVAGRPINNPVAFDCYLRARQVMYHWTPEAQQQALRLVDQAMDIVGKTPLLLATKGQIHWNVVQTGLGPEEGLERASDLTAQALELEPDHDLAIYVRGLVSGTLGHTEAALVDLYRTRQRRPGDGNVLVELCRYSLSAGLEGRSAHLAHLMQVDPLTPQTQLLASMAAYYDGRHPEAVGPARRAIELAPDPSMLHAIAGLMIAAAGFHEEASEVFDRVVTSRAAHPHRHFATFLKHALTGDEGQALQAPMAELEASLFNEHLLRMIVDGYALLRQHEDALRVLRAAVRRGFINHPNLSTHSAALEGLRETPEFQEILTGVKPRWEAVIEWERGL